MQPRTVYRTALIMIPLSIVVGFAAAVGHIWPLVALMAINLVLQLANLRISRQRLRGRR